MVKKPASKLKIHFGHFDTLEDLLEMENKNTIK